MTRTRSCRGFSRLSSNELLHTCNDQPGMHMQDPMCMLCNPLQRGNAPHPADGASLHIQPAAAEVCASVCSPGLRPDKPVISASVKV